jgi:hypothetical protein
MKMNDFAGAAKNKPNPTARSLGRKWTSETLVDSPRSF